MSRQYDRPYRKKKLPEDIKRSRKVTRIEFERLCHKYLAMTKHDLDLCIRDPETKMIDLLIAGMIVKGVQNGDPKYLDFFLNRLIGTIVREIKITQKEEESEEAPIQLTKEDKLYMIESFKQKVLENDSDKQKEQPIDVEASQDSDN